MIGQTLYGKNSLFEPGSHYSDSIKGKFGTQTITVQQQSPFITLNLAQLVLPFSNIATDQLVKYQVQYFDFPSNNVLLYKHEVVYIYAYITFVKTDCYQTGDYTEYHHDNSSPYNSLGYPIVIPRDISGNAEEVAELVRQYLKSLQQALPFQLDQQSAAPVDVMPMAYLLRGLNSFVFDGAAGKFGCVFSGLSGQSCVPMYTDGEISSTSDFRVSGIDVFIRPDPTLSEVRQQQITQLFGGVLTSTFSIFDIGQEKEFPQVLEAQFQSPRFDFSDSYLGVLNGWFNPYGALAMETETTDAIIALASSKPGADIGSYLPGLQGITSMLSYPTHTAQIQQSQFVYLRSSGNTSNWSADKGGKTDVLAILPWTRAFGDSPSFHTFVQNDTYGVVENISSVKTLNLSLTDSVGRPLTFTQTFTIKFGLIPVE